MQIVIDFDSCWQNSFYDGSNNAPTPKGGRRFLGSSKQLNDPKQDNYRHTPITHDTVMGVLNRLIGDKRKLWQARAEPDYYFASIEPSVTFSVDGTTSHELAVLRNLTGNLDPNAFCGAIKQDHPMFHSDYSQALWGILWLDMEQLCETILTDKAVPPCPPLDPVTVLERLQWIAKQKAIDPFPMLEQAVNKLQFLFPKYNPTDKKDRVYMGSLYCSALYLQLERLSAKYNVSTAKAPKGGLFGISHNGVTASDFMKPHTGGQKKVYTNPYHQQKFIKGQGKTDNKLVKSTGKLTIDLDLDDELSLDLFEKIRCAGVATFPLGKKGLAFVERVIL